MSSSVTRARAFGKAMPAAATLLTLSLAASPVLAQSKFNVIAFYTGINDAAHVSFVKEANVWFPKAAKDFGFTYESTNNWNNLNDTYLAKYQVILFLDTRPEQAAPRDAFKRFMDRGGGWMSFHFAAFALAGSTYTNNWSWYHDTFLQSGEYKSNTWRPTSAFLKVEDANHPAMAGLGNIFKASPNEWYAWKNDLRTKPDIQILLSVDPSSFPLGTGPKAHEIWHSGYYPIVWSNKKFRMIYANMGHNDMDYGGTNKELSWTFANETQNKFMVDALFWLAKQNTTAVKRVDGVSRQEKARMGLRSTPTAPWKAGQAFRMDGRLAPSF